MTSRVYRYVIVYQIRCCDGWAGAGRAVGITPSSLPRGPEGLNSGDGASRALSVGQQRPDRLLKSRGRAVVECQHADGPGDDDVLRVVVREDASVCRHADTIQDLQVRRWIRFGELHLGGVVKAIERLR